MGESGPLSEAAFEVTVCTVWDLELINFLLFLKEVFKITFTHLFWCGAGVYHVPHVEIRGQLTEVGSPIPPCRFWESNPGPQSWQQQVMSLAHD